MHKQKKILLAVSNDLVTDMRVHKIATTLVQQNYFVTVLGVHSKHPLHCNTDYKTRRLFLLFSKGFLFYLELQIRICLYALFSRASIFTANDLDTLPAMFVVAKVLRKPIVLDMHEHFTQVPELIHKPFVRSVWLRIEKFCIPRVNACSTVCNSIATEFEQSYGKNFSVIKNVPYRISKVKKVESSTTVILYQGVLNKHRGLELVISAMEYLQHMQLLIVGGGPLEQELRMLVKQKNLDHIVTFTGKIHFSKMLEYTQKASLGLSIEEPSCKNYVYALPNKLFDYIQWQVPVLVSDLPEMKKIINNYNCGEIVQERTPQGLALQINTMLQNTEQYSKYVEAASFAAEELCWEQESKKLIELYYLCCK